jgi:hypothetical protein
LIEFHDQTESSEGLPDYFDFENFEQRDEIEKQIEKALKVDYGEDRTRNEFEFSAKDCRLLTGIFTTNRKALGILPAL